MVMQEKRPGLCFLGGILGGAKAGQSSAERGDWVHQASIDSLKQCAVNLNTGVSQVEELKAANDELAQHLEGYEQQRQVSVMDLACCCHSVASASSTSSFSSRCGTACMLGYVSVLGTQLSHVRPPQAALDAMTEYHEKTSAQQKQLESQIQAAQHELEVVREEHAACQAVR